MAEQIVQNALQQQLMGASKMIEDQVDAELNRLDNMDEDDFEALKQRRLEKLKKSQQQKQEWVVLGHGKYEEIPEEKEFFDVCKKSKNVVCHFYRDSTFRCKIVDKHMALLAPKHIETKFVKINAEKCPFLVERLKIKMLPTILLTKDGVTKDYVKGFDDLGGTDEFSTEMLEWRIAQADVINYSGDLLTPPGADDPKQKKGILNFAPKKNIRGGGGDDSSDDDDW